MEHSITIDSKLKVTKVSKVESYTKSKICLKLDKRYLVVEGENLELFNIDIVNGIIECNGTINALYYQNNILNRGFVKRLLK